MNLYEQFETNEDSQKQGVWYCFGDENEPKFLISYASKSNPKYKKRLEELTRPHRRKIEMGIISPEIADKIFKTVFVDCVLLDWKNIVDKEGNPLEYSKENALMLMRDLPLLYENLEEFSKDYSNFLANKKEEELGN